MKSPASRSFRNRQSYSFAMSLTTLGRPFLSPLILLRSYYRLSLTSPFRDLPPAELYDIKKLDGGKRSFDTRMRVNLGVTRLTIQCRVELAWRAIHNRICRPFRSVPARDRSLSPKRFWGEDRHW